MNDKDILPTENNNCLKKERSDDSNYCLRSIVLNVSDAYGVFWAIEYLLQSIRTIGNAIRVTLNIMSP
jgi:hypothetical protein